MNARLVMALQSPIDSLIGGQLIGALTHDSQQTTKVLSHSVSDLGRAIGAHKDAIA
jgi:hypothetical protein